MKFNAVAIVALLFLFFAGTQLVAQSKKTIILVRHAEKDASQTADPNDPDLSPEGRQRAERLLDKVKKYRPGAVYSTDFKRTRQTVEPIAKRRKKEIQTYDARTQQALVDEILKSKTKRFVIAGHSNTVPLLANLLVKKELFKPLQESEYGTIWLIRMKDGVATKVEVLNY